MNQGRWPANVILDEEAAAMLDEQSGESVSQKSQRGKVEIFKRPKSWIGESTERGHSDTGGASRFFYTAKASRAERNAGLERMEEKENKTYGEFAGTPEHTPKQNVKKQNFHPTVKPLALMEYLCELTKTPTGGVVLDCFGGSGTTAMACVNTNRDYILIEKDPEYCEIARRRVEYAKKHRQKGLFE